MLFSALFALATAASTLAAPAANFTRCDNHVTYQEFHALEAQFASDYAAAVANETQGVIARAPEPISVALRRTVHVVWHIIQESTALTGGAISDDAVRSSIDAMNTHYSGSTFRFVLDSITRTTNVDWFRQATRGNAYQTAMKTALHTGDATVLNVYSVGFTTSSLLGYATWPWDYSANHADDGVVILYSSVPGGSTPHYNEGKSLTHEVGHWLGLFHVFDDYRTCNDTDGVSDTPPQSSPSFGCPTSKDSCTAKPGLDSIHNYMDYSDDPCMNQFTPGQIARMQAQALTYRGIRGVAYPPFTILFPTPILTAPMPDPTLIPIPAPAPGGGL